MKEKKCFPLRIAIGALSVSSWRQIYLFEITFYNNLDNIWVIWEHLLSLSFTYKSHANFLQQTSLNNQHCKEIAGMCEFVPPDFSFVNSPFELLLQLCFELRSFCRSIQLLQLEVLVSKHQLLLICFNLLKMYKVCRKCLGALYIIKQVNT